MKIKYIIRYKAEEYEKFITIEYGVDYAYFRALFDALLDKGIDFTVMVK